MTSGHRAAASNESASVGFSTLSNTHPDPIMTLSAEDLGLIREESLRVLQVELERRRPLSAAKKWLLGGGFVTAVTGVLGAWATRSEALAIPDSE